MALQFSDVLSDASIEQILSLPEVVNAKSRINAKERGTEYFSLSLTSAIKSRIFDRMGLDLTNVSSVPMRWIKGDTPAHHDNGISSFTNTYLTYVTDSYGKLIVDGVVYPIARGYGYVFSEGLSHETIGTGSEPRLLLGPMSETGFAVGVIEIINPGGTTVYLRQTAVGQTVSYSTDQETWSDFFWHCSFVNNNTSLGLLNIEFITDITIDATGVGGQNGYFLCGSESIQFGSITLKSDGTRPIITIDGVTDYPGLIQNGGSGFDGYNNIYIMNLEMRVSGGTTLVADGGWFGQTYFGKGTTASNNIILNCCSTGNTGNYGGGIVGRYAGPVKFVSCSSSGVIGTYGGGIVGADSPSSSGALNCESCWSSGVVGTYGGGIVGQTTGAATIVNCFSTGTIGVNAGGISGRMSGGSHAVSQCYSTGAISIRGGGIIASDPYVVTVTNCYSLGYIVDGAGGILGTIPGGNNTIKTVTNCYTTGATAAAYGYIVPGYTNVNTNFTVGTGTIYLSSNYAEAANASSGWNNTRANTVLTGFPASSIAPIGVKWVYAGTNTPYELFAMGYTPYTRTMVAMASVPPAIVRAFSSSVVAGSATSSAVISGKSYAILRTTGGDAGSYGTITVNEITGVISTTGSTTAGTYTLTIRNNGSYHYTTYTLIVTAQSYRPYSLFGLFTNNAQVYYKPHSLASGGVGGVRNHRRKARRT